MTASYPCDIWVGSLPQIVGAPLVGARMGATTRVAPTGICLRVDDRLDDRVVESEGAVDGRIVLARAAGARVAGVEPAGAAELADDLRRGVHDRRAAAAAVDGAGDVPAVDALAARPAR